MKRFLNNRNTILLLFTLGVIGWGAVNALSAAVIAGARYDLNHWLAPYILWLLVFGLLPVCIVIVRHTRKPLWLSAVVDRRLFGYALILGLLALLLFPPIAEALREFISYLFIFAGCSLVCSLLLTFFYRREDTDTGLLKLFMLWAAVVLIFKGVITSPPIQEIIEKTFTDNYHWAVFLVCLILGSIPLFLPARWPSRASEWAGRLPGWLLVLLPALAAALQALEQLTDKSGRWLGLLENIAVLLALVVIGLAILKMSRPPKGETSRVLPQLDKRRYWGLAALIFAAFTLVAYPIARNGLMYLNNDGIAYYEIARLAAKGKILLNGYRAPLLSWLMAPFIALGSTPQISQRVISGLAGLAWAALAMRLSKNFGLERVYRLGVGLSLALLALHHAFYPVTPDMLGAALLLAYFIFITDKRFLEHPLRSGFLSGLFAALAYYTKYYNLPYVLAHLAFTLVLLWLRGEGWRRLLRGGLVTLMTLAVVISPWVAALSAEYGQLTYSTGGEVAHAYVGPVEDDEEAREGLCVIPEGVLTPGMVHPISCYPAAGWSAFDSLENFIFQVQLVNQNMGRWVHLLATLGPWVYVLLAVLVLALFTQWDSEQERFQYAWLILSITVYAAGYMLVFAADFRYYFPIYALMVIAAFKLLQQLVRALVDTGKGFSGRQGLLIRAVFILAAAVSFTKFGKLKTDLTTFSSDCIQVDSQKLTSAITPPFVGLSNRYIWNGKHIAYYTQQQTYGYLPLEDGAAEADQSLRQVGARTFIVPSSLALGEVLVNEYGYSLRAEAQVCGEELRVLGVP